MAKRDKKGQEGHHGEHERRERCANTPEIRELTAKARAEKRLLRFLNDAQFPEQLMVAPNDRFTIDEEEHHTDHAQHHEHLEPEPLMDCEAAASLIVARLKERAARGFADISDVIELNPWIREILDTLFWAFSTPSYGRWDLLYDLQVGGTHVEIEHAALLSTYEVLFLADGTDTVLWDPSDEVTPQFTLLDGPTTGLTANLLCGGHSFLSDGQLLTVGGGGFGANQPTSDQAWKYDPFAKTWTETAGKMSKRRWYPTTVTLGDEQGGTGNSGRVLVAGGSGGVGVAMEVYSEATDSFTDVSQTGGISKTFSQTYPGMHLLPGGEVFYVPVGFGNCSTGSVYSLTDDSGYFTFSAPQGASDGSWTTVSGETNRTKGMSAILLQPTYPFVRVIVVGGGSSTTNATVRTANLSTLSPSWGPLVSIPDSTPRINVNVVLLPDGTVFISGGTQSAPHKCWIYDPNTPVSAWKEMDELNAPRHYHSCALLLPSGKVMAAGGAASGGCTASVENSIEVFSPPYLFNPDGTDATRPNIQEIDGVVPTPTVRPTVHHGAAFVITTPDADDIQKVVLMRPMAATHNTDTEQRAIQCTFWKSGANQVSAIAPDGAHPHAMAPRGYYMLFILNSNGVPSEGKFFHLH